MDTKTEVWLWARALAIYLHNEFRWIKRKYGIAAMIAVPLGSAGFLAFAWIVAFGLFALL